MKNDLPRQLHRYQYTVLLHGTGVKSVVIVVVGANAGNEMQSTYP